MTMSAQRVQQQYNNGYDTNRNDLGFMSSSNNINSSLNDNEFAKLAENRSIFGSYVDNALAYDPNKEKRSVYDIVYAQDVYDPWGKPGAGAPLLDRNTGRIRTKIEGRMQWNLDGLTHSAKTRKLRTIPHQKLQPNLIEYRKSPSPVMKLPIPSEATTYRQVHGSVDNNNTFNLRSNRTLSPERSQDAAGNNAPSKWSRYNPSPSQQAMISKSNSQFNQDFGNNVSKSPRKVNTVEVMTSNNNGNYNGYNGYNGPSNGNVNGNTNGYSSFNSGSNLDLGGMNGNMNNSYFNDAKRQPPTIEYDQPPRPTDYTKLWFGRGGGGAPSYDVRRKKLYDSLENRHLFDPSPSNRSKSEFYYHKASQQPPKSTHKNFYDGANNQ